jgi:signal transduction histidine kinase
VRLLLLPTRPLRALAYVASGVPEGLLVLLALPVLLVSGLGAALVGVPVGVVERYRLRLVDPRPAPSPHGPVGRSWLATRLREAATWQELAFAVLVAVLLWPVELVAVALPVLTTLAPLVVAVAPAGAVPNGTHLYHTGLIWLLPPLGVAMAYAIVGLARLRAALARAVLVAPPERDRLVELTRSRARLVGGFDDERRRLERDLHDGVQQRLLALSVTLGLARLSFVDGDTASLATQLAGAHDESRAILEQLREVVRGIHPRILTDRGLCPAIEELAGRAAVPVHTDLDLPGRFPDLAESTAYFVVSEALSNVDRHSGAGRAWVTGRYADGALTIDVRDDGHGGADPLRGTGLRGLADRAEAAGARLLLSSPPGGPTRLRLELPCPPSG